MFGESHVSFFAWHRSCVDRTAIDIALHNGNEGNIIEAIESRMDDAQRAATAARTVVNHAKDTSASGSGHDLMYPADGVEAALAPGGILGGICTVEERVFASKRWKGVTTTYQVYTAVKKPTGKVPIAVHMRDGFSDFAQAVMLCKHFGATVYYLGAPACLFQGTPAQEAALGVTAAQYVEFVREVIPGPPRASSCPRMPEAGVAVCKRAQQLDW